MYNKSDLDKISNIISSEKFCKHENLWNEVPYYIFDYDPKDEIIVRKQISSIKKQINNGEIQIKLKEFDLFEILLEILKKESIEIDDIKALETDNRDDLEKTKNDIISFTTVWKSGNMLIDYIYKESTDVDTIFLTWIGKVWPLFRSHTILNKLQQIIMDKNVVMFFPWEYTKLELKLFRKFKDDNYYRAFRLVDR